MEIHEADIDDRFRQEDGNAFEHCLICDTHLIDSGRDYFVERVFRRVPKLEVHEVLFEYAVCQPCAEQMRSELSKESIERIEQHFLDKTMKDGYMVHQPLDRCLLTKKEIETAEEYSYHAHCRGNKLQLSIFPYALSDDAMDEIAELLSQKTLDQLDDFKGKYFSGPPEVMDLINPKRLLPI